MSVDYGHCNYFFEKIINVRSVDQMRKRYDFKINLGKLWLQFQRPFLLIGMTN